MCAHTVEPGDVPASAHLLSPSALHPYVHQLLPWSHYSSRSAAIHVHGILWEAAVRKALQERASNKNMAQHVRVVCGHTVRAGMLHKKACYRFPGMCNLYIDS